jgi:hypothetical protein
MKIDEIGAFSHTVLAESSYLITFHYDLSAPVMSTDK